MNKDVSSISSDTPIPAETDFLKRESVTQRARPRVFVSYSKADRDRVAGLGLLLEALGHEVFVDHKTIRPGARWEAALQAGLLEADILVVFWTKRAAHSDWVRREYEYFHAHFPDRLLVPVLGDETPLSELLKTRQHSDFAPLINELLALKRTLEQQGADDTLIQKAILKRLKDAGIELDEKDRKKLLGLFGISAAGGFVGLLTAALGFMRWAGSTATETVAQLSGAQAALVAAGVMSGVGVSTVVGDPICDQSGYTIPSAHAAVSPASDSGVAESHVFGSREWGLRKLAGTVYSLPANTGRLPKTFSNSESLGTIYTASIDVSPRSWTKGFPGVSDRFEWFAIEYEGTFRAIEAGCFQFRLHSDDGAKLFIDSKLVVDNDGTHGPASRTGSICLDDSRHAIRLQYFQGPRTMIALQLFYSRDGQQKEEIFPGKGFELRSPRPTLTGLWSWLKSIVPAGAPDLTRIWNSSYGEVHLVRNGNTYEGWYRVENNTLGGTLSKQGGTWIFAGEWGRKNDPNYKGGFRFTFTSPTAFTGNWWYDGNPSRKTPWTGSL